MLITSLGWGAAITSEAELRTAANTEGSHTIKANTTYALTAGCYFRKNMTITVDESLGAGNVIITNDGGARAVQAATTAQDTPLTITFVGTATSRIVFSSNSGATFQALGTAYGAFTGSPITLSFTYCNFVGQVGGNGFGTVGNTASGCTVTFNNCKAYNNTQDGFSLAAANSNNVTMIMILNNCDSYWNDNINNVGSGDGGGSGDGVTIHAENQYIFVNGGNYYQNGKSGIAAVGGSCIVNGATFYSNGIVVHAGGDIFLGTTAAGRAIISHCNFTTLNTDVSPAHIQAGQYITDLTVSDCNFTSPVNGKEGTAIKVTHADVKLTTISDCLFSGFDAASQYCLTVTDASNKVVANNNTVYGCTNGFQTIGYNNQICNNIFHTVTGYAIAETLTYYDLVGGNGNNCFYTVGHTALSDHTTTGDTTEDPQFVDIANGDFRFKNANLKLSNGRWIGDSAPVKSYGWLK